MTRDLLAGIDFGTGGCKITVIDFDGRLAGEASGEYPTAFPHPGWSEQNPDDWYKVMCRVFADLAASGLDLGRIAAVAPDGSTHNAVLLDEHFKPLRAAIMWTDQRSIAECRELTEKYGDRIFATAFQMPAPTWTLPQLMWLTRHEPEVMAAVRHVLFVKDYVRYLLTGRAATDFIEAEGTLFFDMNTLQWSEELAALAGLRPGALPELIRPCDVAGEVSAAAARDTGLAAGIPVICGTSDSAVEDYGAGAIRPGQAIVKLATAGNFNVMTDRPVPHRRTLTYSHVMPGMWYTVSATNAAAVCQRWMRDLFPTGRTGKAAYNFMDELAAASPRGANGVMFHPYLQGERSPYWDADLRGSFTGLGMKTTRGDCYRALLEGVAFSLRDCRGVIEEMRLPVEELFLIGGGARSALWSRIVCDVMAVPVRLPQPGDASFGAALLAGVGAGVYPDPGSAVKRTLRFGAELEPEPEAVEFYQRRFDVYRAIHDALAPVYSKFKR